jgi:hypothetical protein
MWIFYLKYKLFKIILGTNEDITDKIPLAAKRL